MSCAKFVFVATRAANRQHQHEETSSKIHCPQNDENDNSILHIQARSLAVGHRKSDAHPNDDEDDDPDVKVDAEVISQNLGGRSARGLPAPNDFAELSVEIDREDDVDDGDDDDEDVVGHSVGPSAFAIHRAVFAHEDDAADDGGKIYEERENYKERIGRVLADAFGEGLGAAVAAFLARFARMADTFAALVTAGSTDFTTDKHYSNLFFVFPQDGNTLFFLFLSLSFLLRNCQKPLPRRRHVIL